MCRKERPGGIVELRYPPLDRPMGALVRKDLRERMGNKSQADDQPGAGVDRAFNLKDVLSRSISKN